MCFYCICVRISMVFYIYYVYTYVHPYIICEVFDTTHASADSCVSVVGIRINTSFTEGETLLISE